MIDIRNEMEALFLACEMERRAIELYNRAWMLCQNTALIPTLEGLILDEQEHLRKFTKMGDDKGNGGIDEKSLLLSAYAAQILFPGGLMQAQRQGAFKSISSLVEYAIAGEVVAIETYSRFAEACEDVSLKQMFLTIAREERVHKAQLEDQLAKLETDQVLV